MHWRDECDRYYASHEYFVDYFVHDLMPCVIGPIRDDCVWGNYIVIPQP